VAIGGTTRPGSTTETALQCCLKRIEELGASTQLFGGEFLAKLPPYDPRSDEMTCEQREFVEAVRGADAILIGSPGYHGSISGVVKNALDTLELTAKDAFPYFHGRAVGAVVTAFGWQAAGSTLMAIRSIIHAMRGWPTPFGAVLNSTARLFDEAGACRDAKDAWALATVAEEVFEFARLRAY
jgi:FMN reductase